MSEETIFREVDEELRRDRLRTGWRRYGPYLIAAAVAVVLVVAANEGWTWWQKSNAARSSDQFYTALDLEDGGDLAGAQKALDGVIAQGSAAYPVLARFKQAGLLARQGKADEALAAFDALATSQSNPRLRGLALLLAANLLVDKGDLAGVKSRIQGLLAPDDPLRNAARETIGLAQYKAGDLNGARDSFEAVMNDPQAPGEARGRMQLYISQLVAQGATPVTGDANAPAADKAAPAGGATPTTGEAGGTAAGAQGSGSTSGDATTPAGVESSQPVTPDAALDMAVPAPPATGAASAPTDATTVPAPDATAPAAGETAPPATTTAPAAGDAASPAGANPPAADATVPAAGVAAPAAGDAAQPAPATGSTGQ